MLADPDDLRNAFVSARAALSFLIVIVTTERPAFQGDSIPCITASGYSPRLAIKPSFWRPFVIFHHQSGRISATCHQADSMAAKNPFVSWTDTPSWVTAMGKCWL